MIFGLVCIVWLSFSPGPTWYISYCYGTT